HRDSAFYWFSTIFVSGLIRGLLFKNGYRRLVADIEQHAHTDAVPLVRVYSRRGLRRLLQQFSQVDISVRHLSASDFWHLAPIFRALPVRAKAMMERRFGWYVIARAVK